MKLKSNKGLRLEYVSSCADVRRCIMALSIALVGSSAAQWSQESYSLDAGWSGIWLSHDCSHLPINELLEGHGDILEVWQWNPLGSTAQFSVSPWVPIQSDPAWKVWKRGVPAESTLGTMTGNAAYLVRLADDSPPINLVLVGKPLLPRYEFSANGSNFVGFPTLEPATTPVRSFETFFNYSSVFKSHPPVFYYRNGPLSSLYPVQALPRTTAVQRGRAYWVKNDTYTDYYGPLKITLLGDGLHFGATGNAITLRIANVVDPAKQQTVAFTLAPAPSAPPPTGQPPAQGPVPLRVRGPIDPSTGDFQYTDLLPTGLTGSLAPGEETVITLAVNRTAMAGSPGDLFFSLLQLRDSLNQTHVVLPASARTTSYEGLWAGAAVIDKVEQIVGQSSDPEAAAPSTFTLQLLLHRRADGTTTLLQQVYQSDLDGSAVAGLTESGVRAVSNGRLARMSSSSFPNRMAVVGSGPLQRQGSATFQIDLGYNESSNPFVHSYHPDHDNLDARFEGLLPDGEESKTIRRTLTLEFIADIPEVSDPGWGSTMLGGSIREALTGLRSDPIQVSGSFILHKVSDASVLAP